MNKAFCVTDKAVEYFFHKAEEYLDYVFAETELIRLSADGFSSLKDFKFLKWKQFDWEHTLFVSHIPGDEGTVRYLRKRDDGKYWAYPEEDKEKSRIEVEEKDLPHYVFDIDCLIAKLKQVNALTGKSNVTSELMRFVGKTNQDNVEIAAVLGLFDSLQIAESELMSLPSRLSQYKSFLVTCPTCDVDEGLRSRLVDKGVFCQPFSSIVDNNWKIDFSIVKSKTAVSGLAIPDLTTTEKKKYERDYPRRDVIEFYDTVKGYLIKINGNEMEFDRIQYGLLIFLAKALKADTGCGKVAVKDAVDENIVRDPQHFYRLSGELNKLMKAFVENKKDKIVSKVKGETGIYRLTTMPSRIKQPHTRWLNSKYKAIKGQIAQERQGRGVELNYKV